MCLRGGDEIGAVGGIGSAWPDVCLCRFRGSVQLRIAPDQRPFQDSAALPSWQCLGNPGHESASADFSLGARDFQSPGRTRAIQKPSGQPYRASRFHHERLCDRPGRGRAVGGVSVVGHPFVIVNLHIRIVVGWPGRRCLYAARGYGRGPSDGPRSVPRPIPTFLRYPGCGHEALPMTRPDRGHARQRQAGRMTASCESFDVVKWIT